MTDDELNEKISTVRAELSALEAEWYNRQLAKLPWKAGDIGRSRKGEFEIVGVANLTLGWPFVRMRKKDGSFSKTVIRMWREFEIVKRSAFDEQKPS